MESVDYCLEQHMAKERDCSSTSSSHKIGVVFPIGSLPLTSFEAVHTYGSFKLGGDFTFGVTPPSNLVIATEKALLIERPACHDHNTTIDQRS